MKTKTRNELHAKTIAELKTSLNEAKDAVVSLLLEKMHNKLKNTRSIFLKRKEIAILSTIIKEKELNDAKSI